MGRAPPLLAVAATATGAPKPTGWGWHKHWSCLHCVQAPGQAPRGAPALTALPPPSLVPLQGGHGGLAAGELRVPCVPKHSSSDHTSHPSHGAPQPTEPSPAHCGKAQPEPETPVLGPVPAPCPPPWPCLSPPHLWGSTTADPTFCPADTGAPVPTGRNRGPCESAVDPAPPPHSGTTRGARAALEGPGLPSATQQPWLQPLASAPRPVSSTVKQSVRISGPECFIEGHDPTGVSLWNGLWSHSSHQPRAVSRVSGQLLMRQADKTFCSREAQPQVSRALPTHEGCPEMALVLQLQMF